MPTKKTTPASVPAAASATAISESLATLTATVATLWKSCAVAAKQERITAIEAQLEHGWDDSTAQLQQERTRLLATVEPLVGVQASLRELEELFELAVEEASADLLADLGTQTTQLAATLAQLELNQFLQVDHAEKNCYLDIQFGSGGVESQDWVTMLKRMYVGYANSHNWQVATIEETLGEVGIKSVTLLLKGTNAYGLLRTETGVHRLVRKSPFDSNHRRHTTFASVFAYPVLPESEAIAIDPSELRIDTYRASGAGGQHVNTTDSAVRITHLPTGTVVQCQNSRSQHSNKQTALSMLQSRLQLLQEQAEEAKRQELEATKADISWGSQIRSYVLDQARVKDLRTGLESGSPQAVLDGGLEKFIEASLRAGL